MWCAMPNLKHVTQNANNTKKKQVREEEHDVGMLMLYTMNPVLDDKERKKKMDKKGSSLLKILADLVTNQKNSKSM
jgi:hypothetical protein